MIFDKVDLGIRIVFIVFWSIMLALALVQAAIILSIISVFWLVLGCFESAKLVRKIQDHITEDE